MTATATTKEVTSDGILEAGEVSLHWSGVKASFPGVEFPLLYATASIEVGPLPFPAGEEEILEYCLKACNQRRGLFIHSSCVNGVLCLAFGLPCFR